MTRATKEATLGRTLIKRGGTDAYAPSGNDQWNAAMVAELETSKLQPHRVGVLRKRMAHDLGLPVSELRKLAEHGPGAADLLTRRMAELNLDRNEAAAVAPRTLRDLQRVCTMCESHKQCARDLGRDPADPTWEECCPNVAVLKMLNALPWVSRSEW